MEEKKKKKGIEFAIGIVVGIVLYQVIDKIVLPMFMQ